MESSRDEAERDRDNQGSQYGGEHALDYFESRGRSPTHSVPTIPEGSAAAASATSCSGRIKTKSSGDTVGSSPPPTSPSGTSLGTPSTPVSSENSAEPSSPAHISGAAAVSASKDDYHRLDRHQTQQQYSNQHPMGPIATPWSAAVSEGVIQTRFSPPSEFSSYGQYSPVIVPPQYSLGAAVAPQQPQQYTPAATQQHYNPATYPSALKLLVSNNVAGSIIGRAGQSISELQTQSSTRIKLSQTGDYYPGTQDRVCLVQGFADNIKVAIRLLLERLYSLQDSLGLFVVRLLVPMGSCGMLIGKAGSNIKTMEEASGVSSVRLSPKDDVGTQERIVTVTAPNLESCLVCVCIILENLVSHPEICRYSNMTTSYNRGVRISAVSTAAGAQEPGMYDSAAAASAYSAPGPAMQRRVASSPNLSGSLMMETQQPQLKGHMSYFGPMNATAGASPFTSYQGVTNSSSAPDLLALQMESMSFLTPFQTQVMVPDNLIGSILGRGGRTLHELQMQSQTRIRISQRGEYMPGTRNRIVSIRGPTAQSVSLAQYLMSQRMALPPAATSP